MPKMLQKNERTTTATSAPVRPTQLILDGDFIGKAVEFIKDAKGEILLCAYAWRWYTNEPFIGIQMFNIELLKAHNRGVRVRCILNNQLMYAQFTAQGFQCRYVERGRVLHTKAIVVDHKTIVLGSHNLTKRATTDNYEASVAIQDFEVIAQFRKYFDTMWSASNAS